VERPHPVHARLSESRIRHTSDRRRVRPEVPRTEGAAAGSRVALGLLLRRWIRTCGAV
jgi:hypothetical protein